MYLRQEASLLYWEQGYYYHYYLPVLKNMLCYSSESFYTVKIAGTYSWRVYNERAVHAIDGSGADRFLRL